MNKNTNKSAAPVAAAPVPGTVSPAMQALDVLYRASRRAPIPADAAQGEISHEVCFAMRQQLQGALIHGQVLEDRLLAAEREIARMQTPGPEPGAPVDGRVNPSEEPETSA